MQVSVVVPCFNEVDTVLPLIECVLAAPFDKELIHHIYAERVIAGEQGG